MNYYNEIDPHCCQWLRNLISAGLIPDGFVDERSIEDVRPEDLDGYDQCHFFAGIAGWALAIQLADVPSTEPLWTASCPCQPFSDAGLGLGEKDPRHLWPVLRRLITQRRPATVFGEQVASKAGREWLSGVRTDLEDLAYAVGAADLCAACVEAPHIRQRLYWCANAAGFDGKPHDRMGESRERGPSSADRRFPCIFDDGTWTQADGGGERLPSIVRSFNGLSGILAGYGNAIVPPLAGEFIAACYECF